MRAFEFRDKMTLTSAQSAEMERYLGTTGLTEFTLLKIIRKMKIIEEKLREKKYA